MLVVADTTEYPLRKIIMRAIMHHCFSSFFSSPFSIGTVGAAQQPLCSICGFAPFRRAWLLGLSAPRALPYFGRRLRQPLRNSSSVSFFFLLHVLRRAWPLGYALPYVGRRLRSPLRNFFMRAIAPTRRPPLPYLCGLDVFFSPG